jgi:F-type H+-transporting ATPase subunit b
MRGIRILIGILVGLGVPVTALGQGAAAQPVAPAAEVAPVPSAAAEAAPAPGGTVISYPVNNSADLKCVGPDCDKLRGVLANQAQQDAAHGFDPAAPQSGQAHGVGHHDPSHDFNFFGGMPFGYKSQDVAGGPLGDGKLGDEPLAAGEHEQPMSAPFALMVLNFGLLLFVLARFGGPAARKMAESRSDQIKTALDEASKLRNDAAAKLEGYSKRLAAAEAEIQLMVQGMRTDAENEKQRVIAAAEAQAAALKKDAEERIAAEIDRARTLLAREVAAAASSVAETLLRDKATVMDHARIADGFIADLGKLSRPAGKERV